MKTVLNQKRRRTVKDFKHRDIFKLSADHVSESGGKQERERTEKCDASVDANVHA